MPRKDAPNYALAGPQQYEAWRERMRERDSLRKAQDRLKKEEIKELGNVVSSDVPDEEAASIRRRDFVKQAAAWMVYSTTSPFPDHPNDQDSPIIQASDLDECLLDLRMAQARGLTSDVLRCADTLKRSFPDPRKDNTALIAHVAADEARCLVKHVVNSGTCTLLKHSMRMRERLHDYPGAGINAITIAEFYQLQLPRLVFEQDQWCGMMGKSHAAVDQAIRYAKRAMDISSDRDLRLRALFVIFIAQQILARLKVAQADRESTLDERKKPRPTHCQQDREAASRIKDIESEICDISTNENLQTLVIADASREMARCFLHSEDRDRAHDSIERMREYALKSPDRPPHGSVQTPTRLLTPQITLYRLEGHRDKEQELIARYRNHVEAFQTRNQTAFLKALGGKALAPTKEMYLYYPIFSWVEYCLQGGMNDEKSKPASSMENAGVKG